MFDLIIENGTVVDGTGRPGFAADVGIVGGEIGAVGDLREAAGARRIDASRHAVSPGFIDMHSHSDRTLLDDPGANSKVFQGVTTEVVGNCSYSPFPVGPNGPADIVRSHVSEVEWDWRDLDGWAKRLGDNGVSVNVAPQVGHAALRAAVGLMENRPPTREELREMGRLAAESVEQGAFSLSTGLTLPPGSYASTDEIVALAEAIAPYENAFYATHARLWAGNQVGAVEEAVEIGERAGVPVQYSHMAVVDSRAYGRGDEMVAPLERAAASGMDVAYDVYPYTAAGTHLSQLIPEWVQEGGVPAMLSRLRDPGQRRRALKDMEKGWFRGLPWKWDTIFIDHVESDRNQALVGLSMEEIAAGRGSEPAETFLDLIDEEDNRVGAVIHNRTEVDVRFFLGHPLAMIGSDGNAIDPDGIYGRDRPHPRFYGTFPRVLGRYVREGPSALTLETAVHKMTGFPARRLGLRDRGVIDEGMAADLVVFDPETVVDNATFEEPHRYPEGIPHVLVAGEPVVLNGRHTGARPGRVLRRS